MKTTRCILIMLIFVYATSFPQNLNVSFNVTLNDSLKPISQYIFGTNQTLTGTENWASMRLGGNRLTGYNWENNASNAGSDYNQSSDNYLTWSMGITNEWTPGIVATTFHDTALKYSAYSLITLQMAGYVARDKKGTVTTDQAAPSYRWQQVKFKNDSSLSLLPDTSDGYVYMDEFVKFLVTKYDKANTSTGINGYSLDNETSLWPSTHPRIHPKATTCAEIIQKSVSLSSVVKSIDSAAEIFGPVAYGFNEYQTFQNAPDWNSVKNGYTWFIDYYLDKMKKASDSAGVRLLDVLDLHWYPEAKGSDNNRITDQSASTFVDKLARVQAPRTLWDPSYKENSWIIQTGTNKIPLIPNLLQSIKNYYPGTKLAFTEFTYGGENDISGAIAMADVLGIFAKYNVYFANFWQVQSPSSFVSAAYKIYRNYDGGKSTFGDFYIPSQTSDIINSSVYGSLKSSMNEIHIIAINKSLTTDIAGNFTISSRGKILSGRVWEVDSASNSQIHEIAAVNNISNNSFSYILPKASVCHFVLQAENVSGIAEVKNVPLNFYLKSYPNPFNPTTKISYSVPDNSNSRLEIFSVNGELVKSFEIVSPSGTLVWDGTNNVNIKVASGVYYAVLRNSSQVFATNKLVLLK